ncbi:MAG TPA: penicillin-binding protein 2 [bacterium]|nr:penicillin-binding protein 2 [bacterium]
MKFAPLSTDEVQLFRQRLVLVLGGFALLLAVVLFRLWFLQIIEGGYYEEVAKGNRIRVIPEGAPRGIIYDRQGEILAFNRPSFDVQIILEDTPDLKTTLQHLALVTDTPVKDLHATLMANRRGPRFKPIVLLKDVGRKTADLIETYQEDLPGVSVAVEPKRLYPTAYLDAHVLGYVGVINEDQLTKLPLSRLTSGRIVGQAGIELRENNVLIGTDGGKQVEVDHVGRELKVLSKPINPVPGADIQLTIDLRLQRYIRTLMQGYQGVVIVSKPRTGEVLAMGSYPDYDPNQFVGGIDDAKWRALMRNPDKPLINKAIQGLYPPGSTFKMVLAAAALNTGAIDPTTELNCPGYYRINREIHYCWKRSGHGNVAVAEALEQSCNVFFYQVGMMLGVDTIHDYARMFGFGQPTGIELESEKAGLIPSREWKQRVMGEKWYDGETVSVAIGQGYVSVTPIQLSAYLDTIANGGLWVRPTLIRRITEPDGHVLTSEADLPRDSRLLPLPPEIFDVIRHGMVEAVNGPHATAWRARSRRFTIAGKTGTSQVVGRKSVKTGEDVEKNDDLLAHSLFVGYAPAEDPKVTVTVLVEHGESGGRTAAPIARKILEFYNKNIAPLDTGLPAIRTAGSVDKAFHSNLQTAFDPNREGLVMPAPPSAPAAGTN